MKNVVISDGSVRIRAVLNDTRAAKDFESRLPLTCIGCDSGIDYCCSVASGVFDPRELQTGWKNGDLSLGGGWFALLYGGEEHSGEYKDMMIIGRIHDDDLHMVEAMPARVTLTVSAE